MGARCSKQHILPAICAAVLLSAFSPSQALNITSQPETQHFNNPNTPYGGFYYPNNPYNFADYFHRWRSYPGSAFYNLPDGSNVPGIGTTPEYDAFLAAVQAELTAARQSLADGSGNLLLCRQHLDAADAICRRANQPLMSQSVMQSLLDAAFARLSAADAQYHEGKYLEAIKTDQLLAKDLQGLTPATLAMAELNKYQHDPAAQSALQEIKAAPLYQALLKIVDEQRRALPPPADNPSDIDVVAAMDVAQQASFLPRLRTIATSYKLSPSGRAAAALLTQVESRPQLIAAVEKWESGQGAVRLCARRTRSFAPGSTPRPPRRTRKSSISSPTATAPPRPPRV